MAVRTRWIAGIIVVAAAASLTAQSGALTTGGRIRAMDLRADTDEFNARGGHL